MRTIIFATFPVPATRAWMPQGHGPCGCHKGMDATRAWALWLPQGHGCHKDMGPVPATRAWMPQGHGCHKGMGPVPATRAWMPQGHGPCACHKGMDATRAWGLCLPQGHGWPPNRATYGGSAEVVILRKGSSHIACQTWQRYPDTLTPQGPRTKRTHAILGVVSGESALSQNWQHSTALVTIWLRRSHMSTRHEPYLACHCTQSVASSHTGLAGLCSSLPKAAVPAGVH